MKMKKCIPFFGIAMAILAAMPVSASTVNMNSIRTLSQLSSTKEVEESTASQSDSDEQIKVQSNDNPGMIYDFKDSKTTGVVTATKTWEDDLPNDERPMPDVSISTVRPGKSPLGYTITYHGNGLAFADGTTENEIIVNSSGKIVSGQYKELRGSLGWYLDASCITKIETTSDGLPLRSITYDLDLYAKEKTYTIKGYDSSKDQNNFCELIPDSATSVVFTDELMPSSATLIDVDKDGDSGVVAWMSGNTMKVSTQTVGKKIEADNSTRKMFYNKSNLLSIDCKNLDTSEETTMYEMFEGCSSLIGIEISTLNTERVFNMNSMFKGCSKLNKLDLISFNTSRVSDMRDMFYKCSNLTSINLTSFDTDNVERMDDMFLGCSSLTDLDLTSFRTVITTSTRDMFWNCSALTSLNLQSFSTQFVTDMGYMFYGCKNLISLDLSSFDTSKVTNMAGMFSGCSKLTDINMNSFNTANVTDMRGMFGSCSNLTVLNLSSFDISKVTNIRGMFSYCSKLIELNLSSFKYNKVTDMSYMFYHCNNLESVDMSSFYAGYVTQMDSLFESCSKLTSLALGNGFKFIGSSYKLPSGTWYSADGTAYTSDGTTCTIPNNKADTYTRK